MKITTKPTKGVSMVHTSDEHGNWAYFYVNKWEGVRGFNLTISSSFGNWNAGWGSPGGGPTKFLRECANNLGYLQEKFLRGMKGKKDFKRMYDLFYMDFINEYESYTTSK